MNKIWFRAGIGSVVVLAAYGSLVFGLWKSDARKFAEATCHPTMIVPPDDQIFEQCIPKKFGPGSEISQLRRYLEGGNFEKRSVRKIKSFIEETYVAVQDYEKGARRKRIIVVHDGRIIKYILPNEWRAFHGDDIPAGY